MVKNLSANARSIRDVDLTPGLGRSPEKEMAVSILSSGRKGPWCLVRRVVVWLNVLRICTAFRRDSVLAISTRVCWRESTALGVGVTQVTGVLISSWARWRGRVWAVICTLQVRIRHLGKGSVMPSDMQELCSALFSF